MVANVIKVPRLVAATPSKEEKMFLWPEAFSEYKPSVASSTITETVAA